MKMELTGSLLSLALLCGASSVLASDKSDNKEVRGASSEYTWETENCEQDVTIFKIAGSRCAATVLVHVNDRDRRHDGEGCRSKARGDEYEDANEGVILEGCGGEDHLFVHEGETVRCTVKPGHHGLKARSKNHREENGTIQLIHI